MRVTTDLWVSALVRRIYSAGGFAAIMRRGAAEAGAIFIISRGRLGEMTLFGPAPQTAYGTDALDERQFSELLTAADDEAVKARLEKEMRFDPDVWAVEIEAGPPPEGGWFAVRTP